MNLDTWVHLEEVLLTWAELVYNTYKDKLRDLRASGELEETMSFEVRDEDGRGFSVYLHLAEYWKYIEDGRLPGSWPPVDAIKNWITIKPILPQPTTLPSGRVVLPSTDSLAFLIGRKIAQDGIPMKPLLFETLEELRLGLIADLKVAFAQDVRDKMNVIFDI